MPVVVVVVVVVVVDSRVIGQYWWWWCHLIKSTSCWHGSFQQSVYACTHSPHRATRNDTNICFLQLYKINQIIYNWVNIHLRTIIQREGHHARVSCERVYSTRLHHAVYTTMLLFHSSSKYTACQIGATHSSNVAFTQPITHTHCFNYNFKHVNLDLVEYN